uniref:TLC domain-containing protein n=1 Tax=Mantoniella antarctica TaxID=81844 RepID=A0A7S0SY64_9CHLO
MAETSRILCAFGGKLFGVESEGKLRAPLFDGHTDLLVFALLSLGLFFANWSLRLAVEPVARMLLGKTSTKAKVQKFAQSALEMVFYGAFTVFGILVVPGQEWFWPSERWWSDYNSGKMMLISDALKAYYLLYAARYSQGIVSVLIEHKRKDFWEMQVHHVVTVALITVSYIYGWNRVGSVVMVLLDPADVPLHAAKMCKYIADARGGRVGKACQTAADVFFVIFMLLFAVMRLGLYPYVVWSAHIEAAAYFHFGRDAYVCVVLLYLLLGLQVYWFALILKVAIRVVRSDGVVEDVRSDDEEEEEEVEKLEPKKNK